MASPSLYGTPVNATATSGHPYTQAYTNTVTSEQNTAMFVCCSSGNATPTVSWNGTSMTKIYEGTANQNTCMKLFYLANPATGTHNVSVDYGEDRSSEICIFTFKDCKQTSPTDITLVQSNAGSGTSASNSATTVTNNDAVLTFIGTNGNPTNYVPDGSQILIGGASVGGASGFSLSYIAKATAGSITTGYTWTTSSGWDLNIGAIIYEAPTVTSNIKTLDALAQASIKVFTGLANASTKTWNGVTNV